MEFLCIMISMPFMYGFVNDRCLREIDVMLEKNKGVRTIHLLWIIGLLEADFNTVLNFLFANQMMIIVEGNGWLGGQHRLRKNQTYTYATMIKLPTFECAGAKKSTIGEVSYDCKHALIEWNVHSQTYIHRNRIWMWTYCLQETFAWRNYRGTSKQDLGCPWWLIKKKRRNH